VEKRNTEWPALPEQEFVAGRRATEEDFMQGRAVFWIKGHGHEVEPYEIAIPQYVIWREQAGDVGTRAILIQAEKTIDGVMVGLCDLDGGHRLCTLPELELLGVERPE
jgi:hypothetical protein